MLKGRQKKFRGSFSAKRFLQYWGWSASFYPYKGGHENPYAVLTGGAKCFGPAVFPLYSPPPPLHTVPVINDWALNHPEGVSATSLGVKRTNWCDLHCWRLMIETLKSAVTWFPSTPVICISDIDSLDRTQGGNTFTGRRPWQRSEKASYRKLTREDFHKAKCYLCMIFYNSGLNG